MNSELHDLAAVYALDALDADEHEQFEAHLGLCSRCQAEVAELQMSAATLADLVAVPMPDGLRQRVLSEITHIPQVAAPTRATVVPLSAARSFRHRTWLLSLAAAVIVAVAGIVSATTLGNDRAQDDVAIVLSSPDAQRITLNPSGDPGTPRGATVQVVWSPSRNQVVVEAQGLTDPGPGLSYQLWRLEATGAAPSAVFGPDDHGAARLSAPLDGDPAGWGVTVEPESGSSQPTTPVIYRATV